MIFRAPEKHQKIYVLGACMVLFVLIAGLARMGDLNKMNRAKSPAKSIHVVTQSPTPTSIPTPKTIQISLVSPFPENKNTAPIAPSPSDGITAQAYIVGNVSTGQIYFSKNTHLVNGIASISKLFTAIIAKENLDPNQEIEITQPMLDVYPDSYGILLGEKFTVHDLLYGMLLQSNNNIAEGLAMTSPDFIKKMNKLSSSVGMTETHFEDASGLSSGNISDATDLFAFAKYLYANEQDILAITRTYSYTVATSTTSTGAIDHVGHDFINIDPFVGDPYLIGGKTGRTDEAGETMLSIFDYQRDGKDYPIVIIVLHSALSERQNDSSQLYVKAINFINSTQS